MLQNVDGKWVKILALALGLPNLILGSAWIAWILIDEGIVHPYVGYGLFFLVVLNSLFLMVYYALRKKN